MTMVGGGVTLKHSRWNRHDPAHQQRRHTRRADHGAAAGGRRACARCDRGGHSPDRGGSVGAHRRSRRLAEPAGRDGTRRLHDGRQHAALRRGRRAAGLPASGQRRARDHAAAAARVPGGRRRRPLRARDRRGTRRQPDRGFTPRLAGVVRQRSVGRTASARGPTRRSPRCAAMRSIRRSAATPRSSWRTTRRATSVPAPAHQAGAGNIPAASATVRSSVPVHMPTRDTAPPRARVPAR